MIRIHDLDLLVSWKPRLSCHYTVPLQRMGIHLVSSKDCRHPQFARRTVLPSPSALHQCPRVLPLPLTAPRAPAAPLHLALSPAVDPPYPSPWRRGSPPWRPGSTSSSSPHHYAAHLHRAPVPVSGAGCGAHAGGSEVRERDPHGVPVLVPVPICARDAHGRGSGSLESRPRIPIRTRRMTSIPRPAADAADARVDASTSAASSRSRRASAARRLCRGRRSRTRGGEACAGTPPLNCALSYL
jgi:hypothetical protein